MQVPGDICIGEVRTLASQIRHYRSCVADLLSLRPPDQIRNLYALALCHRLEYFRRSSQSPSRNRWGNGGSESRFDFIFTGRMKIEKVSDLLGELALKLLLKTLEDVGLEVHG